MYPANHNQICFLIRKIMDAIDFSSFTLFLLPPLTAHSFLVNVRSFHSYTSNCTTHTGFGAKMPNLKVYTLWIFQFIPGIKF